MRIVPYSQFSPLEIAFISFLFPTLTVTRIFLCYGSLGEISKRQFLHALVSVLGQECIGKLKADPWVKYMYIIICFFHGKVSAQAQDRGGELPADPLGEIHIYLFLHALVSVQGQYCIGKFNVDPLGEIHIYLFLHALVSVQGQYCIGKFKADHWVKYVTICFFFTVKFQCKRKTVVESYQQILRVKYITRTRTGIGNMMTIQNVFGPSRLSSAKSLRFSFIISNWNTTRHVYTTMFRYL